MQQISEVQTSDGMVIQSNSDTQAELEAAVSPEIETPPAIDAKTAVVTPDKDPETGKFTRKQKREDPVTRMKAATAKEAEAKTAAETAKAEREAIAAERDQLRAELEEARKAKTSESAPSQTAFNPALPPASAADWKRYKAMAGAPKPGDFEDPADYPIAMSQFVADVRVHEHQFVQQEATRETRALARATEIRNKITENGAHPEVLEQISPRLLQTPPLSALPTGAPRTFGNYLIEQAFKSENTRQILIHLSNDQEVQRLATLPPDEVVWEIARLDRSFTASPAAASTGTVTKPQPLSQAKPVFSPVAGSATKAASDGPPGDDASEAEVEAYFGPLRKRYRRGR